MSTIPTLTFSVVVPVYNEAGNARPLLDEIHEVMTALGEPFEVIVVNDGSTDTTLDELRAAALAQSELRIVDLAGNFGEAAALCAGFQAARGALVITLDGDGQNDPHDIPMLVQALEQRGCRVVTGWRQNRKEDVLLRVWPSRLANRLIAAVTRVPLHDNGCGLKVYHRSVVESAALPRGMNRFMPAIFGISAKDVAEVPVTDRRRQHGQSHYGIGRTLVVLRDLMVLRFIIASPRRSEAVARRLTLAGAITSLAAATTSTGIVMATALATGLAALSWWNLRRFNRAQRDGVFRVRRESSRDSLEQAA